MWGKRGLLSITKNANVLPPVGRIDFTAGSRYFLVYGWKMVEVFHCCGTVSHVETLTCYQLPTNNCIVTALKTVKRNRLTRCG